MATGFVTTARGEVLNMDELIQRSKRPANIVDENSTRDTPNTFVEQAYTPQVRGFVPASGDAKPPVIETGIDIDGDQNGPKASVAPKSLAEHAGVIVSATKKTANNAQNVESGPVEEDAVLGDILDQLDAPKKKSTKKPTKK